MSAIQELLVLGFSRTVPSAEKSPWRKPTTAGRGAPKSVSGTVFRPAFTGRTPSASKNAAKNFPGYMR